MRLDRHIAKLPAGEMAYVDEGEGSAVVLLHGFPTSAHVWRDLVPMLAPRARVIAPDLIGYGDSAKPEDPSVLTIRSQAKAVRELLADLNVNSFAVVGHDIGGGVAQLLALEDRVEAMVLADSVAFDAWPIEGVKMIQGAQPNHVTEDFVRNLIDVTFDLGMRRPERLAPEDRAEYVRPWLADPMAVVRAARGIDGQGLDGGDSRLSDVDARVLIVWGEDDPFLSSELAERLGEALMGATVAILPGCSHYVTEDAAETVLPLISQYLAVHYLKESHRHPEPTPVELGVSFERPSPDG
ncbi:MAG TPA: alpha/beta fold hydrolase [Actinomycetota bacterium]|nr:alpha/beta fold hydrolase [Actinomycetota bacterium]